MTAALAILSDRCERCDCGDHRATTISVLRSIAMADKTSYQHHEARKTDGKKPEGGTIWLTPREMAIRLLMVMGEETDSLYFPFEAAPRAADKAADKADRA